MDSARRSLADELRSWPDARLAQLIQARPDLASPVPHDMGVLAARAAVRLSVMRVLDQLDALHLAVLDALALSESTTSYDELVRLTDQTPTVAAALTRLRDLALVWGADDALHLVGAVRDCLGPHPAGLGRPVAVCLARHSDHHVQQVAGALGVQGLRGIADLFADSEKLRVLLVEAPEGAREVIERLTPGPPLGQVRDALRTGPPDTPVRWLLTHGFLVAVDGSTVELPREVGMALRAGPAVGMLRADPPPLDVSRPRGADESAAHVAAELVGRVESLLELWTRQPPSVLRAGGLGVRELRRTAQHLDVDDRVAALLVEVAAAAGLLDSTAGLDPEWVPTPAYDAWLGLPTEHRWTALASAWIALPRLPQLVGERGDRDKVVAALGPDIDRPAAPGERRRVLDLLAGLPEGTAATAASVRDHLRWQAPRRGGRLRDRLAEGTLAEAEQLGVTGRGALSSYARLLLAGNDREASRALGALLPEPLDHVLVQPDLTVVAPGPLQRELGREIELTADVESKGGATVYRVSESSVRRALDAGRSASELQQLFATRSRTPVPQSLQYLIDDVARRHGRLRVGDATAYLRCDDEALLSEVLASRATARLRLRRLAPTVLLSAAPAEEVLSVLRAAGYAPAAEAPDGALLLAAPAARRTPLRPRPARHTEPALSEDAARLAVMALRAGDRATQAVRQPREPAAGRTSAADTLAFLQEAAREQRQVWLGYVDAQGRATSRVVEPRTVEGGFVAAYDHLRQEDRTFAVHRITGVAAVEDA